MLKTFFYLQDTEPFSDDELARLKEVKLRIDDYIDRDKIRCLKQKRVHAYKLQKLVEETQQ